MGKMQKRKGYRTEHEVETAFRKAGFDAARVPLSGASRFQKGDVILKVNENELVGEIKARADGFKQIYQWLEGKDFLVVKADRKPHLVILDMNLFIKLLGEGK